MSIAKAEIEEIFIVAIHVFGATLIANEGVLILEFFDDDLEHIGYQRSMPFDVEHTSRKRTHVGMVKSRRAYVSMVEDLECHIGMVRSLGCHVGIIRSWKYHVSITGDLEYHDGMDSILENHISHIGG